MRFAQVFPASALKTSPTLPDRGSHTLCDILHDNKNNKDNKLSFLKHLCQILGSVLLTHYLLNPPQWPCGIAFVFTLILKMSKLSFRGFQPLTLLGAEEPGHNRWQDHRVYALNLLTMIVKWHLRCPKVLQLRGDAQLPSPGRN